MWTGSAAVVLLAAVSVFPQRHITHPVLAVLDRSALAYKLHQLLGASPQAGDVVCGLVSFITIAAAVTAHGDDRGTARPLLHQPPLSWHGSLWLPCRNWVVGQALM